MRLYKAYGTIRKGNRGQNTWQDTLLNLLLPSTFHQARAQQKSEA